MRACLQAWNGGAQASVGQFVHPFYIGMEPARPGHNSTRLLQLVKSFQFLKRIDQMIMNTNFIAHAFHGSLDEDIETFRVASHFGCRKQALSAIGAKRFLDGIETGTPTIYGVEIECKADKVLNAQSDWGQFGAVGAMIPLRRHRLETNAYNEGTRAFQLNLWEIVNDLALIEAGVHKEALAAQHLKDIFGDEFAVITYRNIVEGDGAGYCVLEPQRIVFKSKSHPDWREIVEAFRGHATFPKVQTKVLHFLESLDTPEL